MAPSISSFLLLASTLPLGLASPSPSYLPSRASGSAGCGKPLPVVQQPAGGDSHPTNFTQTNGAKRTYLIHIPSNYNPNTPVPVIFSFHGNNKTSEQQEDLSQFSNEEFNKDAIAVYPQGVNVSFSLMLEPILKGNRNCFIVSELPESVLIWNRNRGKGHHTP